MPCRPCPLRSYSLRAQRRIREGFLEEESMSTLSLNG